ncbi:hypothetical protein H5410_027355 [Solanum commersonii]|uniref:Uncharacterized protein n=1 Tax=Solanum commersonii TaxID=4109 RepID=A0A9J5Z1R8_SOLCO|nr:hypothetical protein H5410_027355 [Solanum commersonii]
MNVAEIRMFRWMCGHTEKDDKKRRYTRQGGSGLHGRQDEGGEVEMVWTCEEEVCGCARKVVAELVKIEVRRGRGRLKKNRVREVIR